MNSIWAVLFVIFSTFLVKWLLFDEDAPVSELENVLPLQIAEPPPKETSLPLSKSA